MTKIQPCLSRSSHPTQNLFFANATLGLKLLGLGLGSAGMLSLSSCSSSPPSEQSQAEQPQGQGQLEIRANGEDFVRDGFTTKDGWTISFDNLYVGLADVAALQTDPPFDPDQDVQPSIQIQVDHAPVTVVDLADDAAPTALVAQFPEAQAGRYNALGWSVVPATSGPSEGQSLRLVGQASKDGQTIPFTLDWDSSYDYLCGDFIGDQRKGILKAGDRADLEATFHFDHVFGDGDAPPEDDINQKSLGFDPLAALAQDGSLTTTRSDLESQLSPEDFATLETAIAGLAHVGEGHCKQTAIAAN